ncbi:TorA maturation chaperone TorD [Trueperella bonasi]|uniref:TorA maturation chaperone TorD n=1 Tax=Trueperella bonasi TaxID=312286 RepID=A0ABT9NI87_9ACTO|nr:molecular chaperone TorD family protein [Trueperella bonasi]MDP9807044.1 TorA maturation chaperone TorD [Trueperella bonasi]
MGTTPWQDSVPEVKMRAVQVATALFSLARFFVEAPNPEITRRFTDPQMAGTWPVRDEDSLAAIEQIARADEMAIMLNEDFNRMFGPAGALMMAESEYTGENHLPLVQALNRKYEERGYRPQKTEGYPRDHFAVQLGFLGHLVAKLADEPGVAAEVRAFRAEHVDRYADDLLTLLDAHARTQMYRGVVVLTRRALDALDEVVGMVGAEPAGEVPEGAVPTGDGADG